MHIILTDCLCKTCIFYLSTSYSTLGCKQYIKMDAYYTLWQCFLNWWLWPITESQYHNMFFTRLPLPFFLPLSSVSCSLSPLHLPPHFLSSEVLWVSQEEQGYYTNWGQWPVFLELPELLLSELSCTTNAWFVNLDFWLLNTIKNEGQKQA